MELHENLSTMHSQGWFYMKQFREDLEVGDLWLLQEPLKNSSPVKILNVFGNDDVLPLSRYTLTFSG
jgi:hypothetical protein